MDDHRSISPLSHLPAGYPARLSSDDVSLDNSSTSQTHLRAGSPSHNTLNYSTIYRNDEALPAENQPSNLRTSTLRSTYQKRLSHFGWWWEVYATLLAVASTASIVAVLVHVNGKPLSLWTLPIQPNSLVAVFSTIAKSALLVPIAECLSQLKWNYFEKARPLSLMQIFDDASRGPWGALKFLWTTRATTLLASAGAFLMLLMLAFEPFTQQVIQFHTNEIPLLNERGSMSYTKSLSGWQFSEGASPSFQVQITYALALMTTMAATGKSTFRRSLGYPSNEYCSTKFCTFQDFTSLGACTTCESKNVLIDNAFGCAYYVRYNGTGDEEERQEYAKLQDFQQAVRRNLTNMTYYGMNCTREKEGFPTFGVNYEVLASAGYGYPKGMGQPQGSTDLKIGEVFEIPGMTVTGGSAMGPGQFNGTSLAFCASGFGRQLGGKNATFDTINTFTCLESNWWLGKLAELDTFGEFNATLSWCRMSLCAQEHSAVSVSNRQQDDMGGATVLFNTKETPLKEQVGRNPGFGDILATAEGIPGYFLVGSKSMSFIAQFMENTLYAVESQPFIRNARFSGNENRPWSDFLTSIGQATSAHIRSNYNPDAGNITGKAFGAEIFVDVRWAWFTLPLLLAVLSILFLILTALQSSRKPYLFKSSILATILYGLEGGKTEGLQTSADDRETGSDLTKLATGVQARLVRNEDGSLRFVRQR